jgi:hypothetical protein
LELGYFSESRERAINFNERKSVAGATTKTAAVGMQVACGAVPATRGSQLEERQMGKKKLMKIEAKALKKAAKKAKKGKKSDMKVDRSDVKPPTPASS